MVILALRLSPSSKKLRQNTFYFCPFFEEPPLRVVLFSLRGVFNIFRWRSCYSLEKFAKDVCLCLRLPDMVKYLRLLLWFGLQMRALVQGRIIVLGGLLKYENGSERIKFQVMASLACTSMLIL